MTLAPNSYIATAEDFGRNAYTPGLPLAFAADDNLRHLLATTKTSWQLTLLEAWVKGWRGAAKQSV